VQGSVWESYSSLSICLNLFRFSACFTYGKTVINKCRVEKSGFESQSEENSVRILKWTTLLGLFCKISFTPAVTFCYQVNAPKADIHIPPAALLCYFRCHWCRNLSEVNCILHWIVLILSQRRSQNEAEEAMPPPEKTCYDFSLVFYINLNCSKTNGRNSRTHVVSCSLTGQGLTWLFAIGYETIRLKHATLLAKLPINADNTSCSVAWMKCKAAVFLQRSTNSDETFLRGLFAWGIAEPNRNMLGQDMINLKRTTQWSVMQQRNVSHSTVGIVASGYAKPCRRDSILKCTASHCQRNTQT